MELSFNVYITFTFLVTPQLHNKKSSNRTPLRSINMTINEKTFDSYSTVIGAVDDGATSALKALSKSPPFSTKTFSACILGISNS